MKRRFVAAAAALVLTTLAAVTHAQVPATEPSAASPAPELAIPFERYTLDNGLIVIFHEDHSQPLVVTSLQVHVGSRDEKLGRTGFAHLFEHLMFMGTSRVPIKKFDEWMELEGGANNAQTSQDWTRYFDVAPSHALPLLLWMEADRFQTLGREITQEKLDVQRGVVRNERRDNVENTPYASADVRLPELLFPLGHPYHFDPIGSHEDLLAAEVGDVRAFFDRWYVPQNTSLVVAGDFDSKATRELVASYFGSLAGGPVPGRTAPPPAAPLGGVVRETLEDTVTLPKIIMAWPSPARFAPGDADLDLLASVLTAGKNSRLFSHLVYDQKIAQSVAAHQLPLEQGSYFAIEAVANPGVSLDALERAIDAELGPIASAPVSPSELARALARYELGFVSGLESLLERALQLNDYEQSRGDPGFTAADLARYRAATVSSMLAQARRTFDLEHRVILRVVPRKQEPAPSRKEEPAP